MHGFASTTSRGREFRIRRHGVVDEPRPLRYRSVNDPRPIGLNVVPLVDVTFLLMIFFVIAGTFDTWEGVLSSRMPAVGGSKQGAAVALPISPITVRLSRGGADPNRVVIRIEDFDSSPASFVQLSDELARIRALPGFDAETMVILQADDDVSWQHVVNGWNAAVRAGFKSLAYGDAPPVLTRP